MRASVALAERDRHRRQLVVAEGAQAFARLVRRPLGQAIHPPPGRVARLLRERQAGAHVAGQGTIDSVHGNAHGARRLCRRRYIGARGTGIERGSCSITGHGAAARQRRGQDDAPEYCAGRRPSRAIVVGFDGAPAPRAHEDPGSSKIPERAQWILGPHGCNGRAGLRLDHGPRDATGGRSRWRLSQSEHPPPPPGEHRSTSGAGHAAGTGSRSRARGTGPTRRAAPRS